MDLKTFIQSLDTEKDREAFATRCETTLGHLRNVMYAYRPCGPELAVLIERDTNGAVRRWELRPDDWPRIWPELIDAPGAPAVSTEQGM